MKLHFLGTAAAEGWPALFCTCDNCMRARANKGKNIRTRCQMLVDDQILIDFGPDTYFHAIRDELDLAQVHTVLLTHSHTDHFYPSELILRGEPYAFDRAKNKMTIYGNGKCYVVYRHMLAVENDSPNLDQCVSFEQMEAFRPYAVSGYRVTALDANHDRNEECYLYLLESPDGKTLLYGNDTGYFPDSTWEHLEEARLDVVTLDCTMGGQECYDGHMGLSTCKKVRKRLLDMGCAHNNTTFILNHFSHNGGLLHHELEAAAGEGFQVAWDGMVFEK